MLEKQVSQLQVLHGNLSAIDKDIQALETPIEDLDKLLGDLSDALKRPKEISDDLKTIGEVLSVVESIASDAAWIPEIGEAAGALAEALKPLVSIPEPDGAIGEMRTTLAEMDETLDPVRCKLKKVKDPVDKTFNAIDKVNMGVLYFESGTEALIKRYGTEAPENVESCAERLNEGMDTIARDFDNAKDDVLQHVQRYMSTLRDIETEFQRAEGYVSIVERVFKYLSDDAFKAGMREVTRLKNKAESYGRAAFKTFLKTSGVFNTKAYKEIKRELDSAKSFLQKTEGRLSAFIDSKIDGVLKDLETRVEREVGNIPELKPLEQEAAKVESTLNQLNQKLTDFLTGECAKVLGTPT